MTVLYYGLRLGVHDRRFLSALCALGDRVVGVFREGVRWGTDLREKVQLGGVVADAAETLDQEVALNGLRRWLDQERPAVVLSGPLWPCAYEAALARPKKLIAVSWAFDVLLDAERSWEAREGLCKAVQCADRVLFDNPWVLRMARNLVAIPGKRSRVFAWGVNTQLFRPKPRVDHEQRKGFYLLHTRNLDTVYRPDVLLYGVRLALSRVPRLRVGLIGRGPLVDAVKRLASRIGIAHSLDWITECQGEELARIYANATAYVTASESDGSSISLLEAMATGLPVAVPDLPSNCYVLGRDATEQTFHLGDAESLAHRIVQLADSGESRRKELGDRNRRRVIAIGDAKSFGPKLKEIVEDVLRPDAA